MPVAEKIKPISCMRLVRTNLIVLAYSTAGTIDGGLMSCSVNDTRSGIAVTVREKLLSAQVGGSNSFHNPFLSRAEASDFQDISPPVTLTLGVVKGRLPAA